MPELQGRGIGPSLFRAWTEAASDVGAMHGKINAGNARAVRFWRRQGFVPLDVPDPDAGSAAWMGRPREV